MADPTLKDFMESLTIIKSSMETAHGRLDRLDRSVDNIQTRLNKLDALIVKIVGLEESQEYISKDCEDQKRKIAKITALELLSKSVLLLEWLITT